MGLPDSNQIGQMAIRLFGSFQVTDQDQSPLKFRSNSERALLIFLAVESDRAHSREFLFSLIWPELDEENARNNFRVTLSRLRKSINRFNDNPVITSNGQSIRFNPDNIWVDALAFTDIVQKSIDHQHSSKIVCNACVSLFEQAAEILGGEFLQGFYLPGSIPFLEWMTVQRERFHHQAINIFYMLTQYHLHSGNPEKVQIYALRQLELAPWREEAHRQLMTYFTISGQKSAALAHYEKCAQILEEELGVSPSYETEMLYQRIKQSRKRKRLLLPEESSRFIGRKSEQGTIIQKLSQPDCRLLTIVGMGGVGKTRLAAQIAMRMQYAFLDGAIYIPLANIKKAERIPYAVADALGFSFSGSGEPFEQLRSYLENKEYFLVLDNFEHLQDGVVFLEKIWQTCPKIKMLVTSRERLGLKQECLINLQGLPVYRDDDSLTRESSAYDLLLACIQRIEPAYAPVQQEKNWMLDLCYQVKGMPLALELIAPMTRVFSMQELVADIGELEQSRLSPVFERSWVLLTAEEKKGLTGLSIFNRPFTREAAIAVADIDLALLESLLDKSLIQRVADKTHQNASHGSILFDFHPLLKQFVHQKLASDSEWFQQVTTNHGTYFLEYLESIFEYLYSPQENQALAQINHKYEDVTTAILWGCDHGEYSAVYRGMNIYIHYYESYGRFQEGKLVYEEIVCILEKVKELNSSPDQELNRALGMAYWYFAWHLMRLGRNDEALNYNQKSVSLARKCGDMVVEAGALNSIGLVWVEEGEIEKGRQFLEKAVDVAYRDEHTWHIAAISGNLGRVAMTQSQFEKAESYFSTSMELSKKIGHYWSIAGAHLSFGILYTQLEKYDEAYKYLSEGLEMVEHYQYRWMKIKLLLALGDLAFKKGDWHHAVNYYQDSFDSTEEFGSKAMLETAQENYRIAKMNLQAEEAY